MTSIPIVDQRRPEFADEFVAACRDLGFVAIVGHGIPPSMFDAMHDLVCRLFEVDQSAKDRLTITADNYRGFIPLGFFTPNRTELTGRRPTGTKGSSSTGSAGPITR